MGLESVTILHLRTHLQKEDLYQESCPEVDLIRPLGEDQTPLIPLRTKVTREGDLCHHLMKAQLGISGDSGH